MTIGLFAPLPLAMMIPFMAGQSLMMGEAFGKGFQYGKRKISSMSNEEFNALTSDDLGKSIQTDYNAIIPHLGQAVKASSEFQSLVIKEIIDVVKQLPADIYGGITGTSDPNTISTSASIFDVRGSSRAPPIFNEQAIPKIEELIKQYMQATGLTDFENAKKQVLDKIRTKRGLQELNASIKGGLQNVVSARTPVIKKTPAQSRMEHARQQAQRSVDNAQARVDSLTDKRNVIRQQIKQTHRRLAFQNKAAGKRAIMKLIIALNKNLAKTESEIRIAIIQLNQFKAALPR